MNFLLIESMQRVHYYYGDEFKVEFPDGLGAAEELCGTRRANCRGGCRIFFCGATGAAPVYGDNAIFQNDPHWRDLILFYEYFHGETGAGLGASHQTGWTALVAKLIEQSGE